MWGLGRWGGMGMDNKSRSVQATSGALVMASNLLDWARLSGSPISSLFWGKNSRGV